MYTKTEASEIQREHARLLLWASARERHKEGGGGTGEDGEEEENAPKGDLRQKKENELSDGEKKETVGDAAQLAFEVWGEGRVL